MTGSSATDRRRRLLRLLQGGGALGAVAAAALAGAPSEAGDRTLTGRLSQTFLGDTNLQVDRNAPGASKEGSAALGSRSRLSLDYSDATPTALFRFGGDIDYDLYTGSDNSNLSGLFPDLSASYRLNGPRSVVQVSAFGSAQPVDFFDFDGGDFFDPNATPEPIDPTDPNAGPPNLTADSREAIRTVYGMSFSLEQQVTRFDSASFSMTVQRRDFIDGGRSLTPTNQFTSTTGWERQLSSKVSAGVELGTSVLKAEGSLDTETYTFSLSPTVSYAPTPRRSFNLSLGPQYSISDRKQAQPGGGLAPDVGYTLGLRASAGFSYSYDAVTTALSLDQSVSPNDEGDAVNRTSIEGSLGQRLSATMSLTSRARLSIESPLDSDPASSSDETLRFVYSTSLQRQVNSLTDLDFKLGALYRDDGQNTDVAITAGAGYTRKLTRDTGLRLAYDLRIPMGDIDDEDDSHRISLTLTRDFTLLP